MSQSLRIIYAGTPAFAVPALRALTHSEHEVVAVYTQPDRPAGRGRKIQFSPVKQAALDAGLTVLQPDTLQEIRVQAMLAAQQADLMVVAAYGLILPRAVLETPRCGCLNIHASLLPRWRGAAPIQRAIQAGDTVTGVTIMQMAAGLDTGDMLHKRSCPITAADSAQTIHDSLAQLGAEALLTTLDLLLAGQLKPEVQDEALACYAHKLTKAEAEIDWTQPAAVIDRQIRAFDAWPTAYSYYNGQAVRFFASELPTEQAAWCTSEALPGTVVAESRAGLDIRAGDGRCVRILQLQMPGSKRMTVAEFINARTLADARFTHRQQGSLP